MIVFQSVVNFHIDGKKHTLVHRNWRITIKIPISEWLLIAPCDKGGNITMVEDKEEIWRKYEMSPGYLHTLPPLGID